MLVSIKENSYRILFRVRTKQYSRIIDPVGASFQHAKGFSYSNCEHKASINSRQIILQQETYSYSFDEAVGRWPPRNEKYHDANRHARDSECQLEHCTCVERFLLSDYTLRTVDVDAHNRMRVYMVLRMP